jgi:hypothetical protein
MPFPSAILNLQTEIINSMPASSSVARPGKMPVFAEAHAASAPITVDSRVTLRLLLHRVLSMPRDAKFGMVVGVSLVIVVAVFFFRKEAPAVDPAAATIVKPVSDMHPPPVPMRNSRSVQAKAMTHAPTEEPRDEANDP